MDRADSLVSNETWETAGLDYAKALVVSCDPYGGSWVSTILMAYLWPAGSLPNSPGLLKSAQPHLKDRHGSVWNQSGR